MSNYAIDIWTLRGGTQEFWLTRDNVVVSRHATEAEAMDAYQRRVAREKTTPSQDQGEKK
jgi:hypothetical protein